jgi:hypothetical protein
LKNSLFSTLFQQAPQKNLAFPKLNPLCSALLTAFYDHAASSKPRLHHWTHEAYQSILPILESAITQHGKIQLLLELHDFQGWQMTAAIDDLAFAFKHRHHIEKFAVIWDGPQDAWISLIDQPFSKGLRSPAKYFPLKETEKAWKWVSKAPPASKTTAQSDEIPAQPNPSFFSEKDTLRFLVVGQSPLVPFIASIFDRWCKGRKVQFAHYTEGPTQPAHVILDASVRGILDALDWAVPLAKMKGLSATGANQWILQTHALQKLAQQSLPESVLQPKSLIAIEAHPEYWVAQFAHKKIKACEHLIWLEPLPDDWPPFPRLLALDGAPEHFSSSLAKAWDQIHYLLRKNETAA